MILNYPWRVYKGDNFKLLTIHYISELKQKTIGDMLNTVEGKFKVRRISEETREIWV